VKWRQAKHNATSWIQAAIEIKKLARNIHYWYIYMFTKRTHYKVKAKKQELQTNF